MGRADKLRPLWRHYWSRAQGLIFMVDANDVDRIPDARTELEDMLAEEFGGRRDWPVLVLANKQDLLNACSVAQISEDLGLRSLRGRQWHVAGCTMSSAEGIEALDWLKTAIGAGGEPAARKRESRPWTELAMDPETAGELLTSAVSSISTQRPSILHSNFTHFPLQLSAWASGWSDRGVVSDPQDAERVLRPHLQRLVEHDDSPTPAYLDAGCVAEMWSGHTALHICATTGNVELAWLLLAARAQVDTKTTGDVGGGQTALALALLACSETPVHATAEDRARPGATTWTEMLLKAGADPAASVELLSSTGRRATGHTTNILMLALNARSPPSAIRALLTAGADPNAGVSLARVQGQPFRSRGGGHLVRVNPSDPAARTFTSPLRAAIIHGDGRGKCAELVSLLLGHGASTDGDEGCVALMAAIIEADTEAMALLLDRGIGITPAHIVEAASKLTGPIPSKHFVELPGLDHTEPTGYRVEREDTYPAVELLEMLLDSKERSELLTKSVANAAALAAVRACSMLTAHLSVSNMSVAQLHPTAVAQHIQRGQCCVQVCKLQYKCQISRCFY